MAVASKIAEASAPPRRVGRPKGKASLVVNVRIPLDLLARIDRYLDYLETTTGMKANRGMIANRALVEFLERHEKKQE